MAEMTQRDSEMMVWRFLTEGASLIQQAYRLPESGRRRSLIRQADEAISQADKHWRWAKKLHTESMESSDDG